MSILLRRAIQQILKGLNVADVFSVDLWTGNATIRDITTGLDSVTNDSLVWTKTRGAVNNHMLVDTIRGAGLWLDSSTTAADASAVGQFDSFLADGYRLGTGSLGNQNATTIVGWQFLKAAGFLDIITYTGDGIAGRTVAHSLGTTAGMAIVKRRDGASNWNIQHRSRGGTKTLYFNTAAETSVATHWNNTSMDDVNVTLGTNSELNAVGGTYIMYVFAHEPDGVIQCGSYTGNGSATGPVINLGWQPQFIIIKRVIGGTGEWGMFDTTRGITTGNDQRLNADTSGAEAGVDQIELTVSGFTPTSINSNVNANASEYIYMAIKAE